MTPNLQKLRRFSLALGVILFSYVVAGFDPVKDAEGKATVNLPLVAFKVDNPEYIPIGLVVASAWGLVLFWYYGLMLQRAPWRHRAGLLRDARGTREGTHSKTVPVRQIGNSWVQDVRNAFPRFLTREILGSVVQKKGGSDWIASVNITRRQRVSAWFHDLDYSAPIWVNAIALGAWFYSVGWLCELAVSIAILGLVGFAIHKWSEQAPTISSPET